MSKSTLEKSYVLLGSLLVGLGILAVVRAADSPNLPELPFPKVDMGLQALAARQQAQRDTIQQFKVFHDFQFTDKLQETGITFVHHAVPEATSSYMKVHYDHGTGIAVADVDGDGLYDIYFVNQVGGNELWRNLGNGKFQNITEQAGVALKGRISVGASFADVNNTGRPDLFVTTVMDGNVLFRNDGNGHFTDITQESGLALKSHSSGALFFDYDRDGLLDLLVCNVGVYTSDERGPAGEFIGLPDAFMGHLHPERFEHPVLYKNLGNYHFKDVTEEVGLNPLSWSGDVDVTDLNGDDWPDIYLPNMQGTNHYFENRRGKSFIDSTAEYFPKTPWGAMGVKFFDFDNDGRMDLYVTDMHSDMMQEQDPAHEQDKITNHFQSGMLGGPESDFIFGNAFYHNLGGGKFEEISDKIGAETYWPWGISVGDVNADGWEDVFITAGMNFPFRYGINTLLLNNRGENFLQAQFLLGLEPRRQPYTPWFVVDCGDKKTQLQLKELVCGNATGKVVLSVPKASRSAVIFDLDNDGDLDIVTNDFNSEPQVFISDLAQQRKIHWLKILLQGTTSNREGLGATVRVTAASQTFTKYNDGKSGYLSQSALPLYFGLGDADKVNKIEVQWPSGKSQLLHDNLPTNQTLTITEPK
jgi:enediyne biosynthesis protein E4